MKENTDSNNSVTIEDLWKSMNISSLLILKLFDSICASCNWRSDDKIRVPIHYMCYEYGMKNCKLYDKNELVLQFNADIALKDQKITTSNYYTFIDRLIDCEYYNFTLRKGNDLYVGLEIPKEFKEDIELVKSSRYSKVSENFKSKMLMDYSKIDSKTIVPNINNKIYKHIVAKNIPARIVFKNKKLLNELINVLNLENFDHDNPSQEFYIKWNPEKEELTKKQMNSIWKVLTTTS